MKKKHELAGCKVRLKVKPNPDFKNGAVFHIEDWWENIAGQSWMTCVGNPACLKYAMRSALAEIPTDDNVVYGKVGPFGHLVHVSELGDLIN